MKRWTNRIVAVCMAAIMSLSGAIPSYATESGTSTTSYSLTFDNETDGGEFTGSGWAVADGAYKATAVWSPVQLTKVLPLDKDITVSFDFYMEYNGNWTDSLLGFGFMNADKSQGTFGWLRRNEEYGDLLTWTKDSLGGPFNGYVGDQIVRTLDQVNAGNTVFGRVHHVDITLLNGNMTVSVDDVLMSCTSGASLTCDITEGYFTLLATNTTACIDNLTIDGLPSEEDDNETDTTPMEANEMFGYYDVLTKSTETKTHTASSTGTLNATQLLYWDISDMSGAEYIAFDVNNGLGGVAMVGAEILQQASGNSTSYGGVWTTAEKFDCYLIDGKTGEVTTTQMSTTGSFNIGAAEVPADFNGTVVFPVEHFERVAYRHGSALKGLNSYDTVDLSSIWRFDARIFPVSEEAYTADSTISTSNVRIFGRDLSGVNVSANRAIQAIRDIGNVTMASENLISFARETYNALTPEEQAKVTNYSVLTAAESAFTALEDYSGYIGTNGKDFTNVEGVTFPETFTSSPSTMSAWIKVDKDIADSTHIGTIVGNLNKTGAGSGNTQGLYESFNCFNFEVTTNGNLQVIWRVSKTEKASFLVDNVDVRTGKWMHVAATRDAANNKLCVYVNGVLAQEKTVYEGAIANIKMVHPVMIGSDYNDNPVLAPGENPRFKGSIAGVHIYNTLLDATEIAQDITGDVTDGLLGSVDFGSEEDGVYFNAVGGDATDAFSWKAVNDDYFAAEDDEFTMAVFPDTQVLFSKAVDGAGKTFYDEGYDITSNAFYKNVQWLIKNKEALNLQHVIHAGDMTDNLNNKQAESHGIPELETGLAWMSQLSTSGISWSLSRGNHDGGFNPTYQALYDERYTYETYGNIATGTMKTTDMRNAYYNFEACGQKYMIVVLDVQPSNDEIAWANELIEANPDRRVIINTHAYMDNTGEYLTEPMTGDAEHINTGDVIWEKLASQHANICMVICGHKSGTNIVKRQDVGVHGNTVYQYMIDESHMGFYGSYQPGVFALLTFSDGGNTIDFNYYSASEGKLFRSMNQFTVSLDGNDYVVPVTSVNVLSPDDSSNFESLTTSTGGSLTTLNDETVYYSSTNRKGFSYSEEVTDYSWELEFMSAKTDSDLRIYFQQPEINSVSGYVLRFYNGVLTCFKSGGTTSKFNDANAVIFKSKKEYRDGNWHTLNVTKKGNQFFVSLDGMKFDPMTIGSSSSLIDGIYTIDSAETDYTTGYLGIYGPDFYVRNFQVDFFNDEEAVADAQFDALHEIYMQGTDVCVDNASEYAATQQAKVKEVGANYRDEVLSCYTEEEIATVMEEYKAEIANVTFKDWIGGLEASEDTPIVVGGTYTTTDYEKQVANNFRFDLDVTFAESSGDVRIYFCTDEAKEEGYLLRFWKGYTILYKSPFLGTSAYWNNPATYAVFRSTEYNWQDGKKHQLSFNVCDNQFYLTIDGEFLTVTSKNIYDTNYANHMYTNATSYGDMYLKMAGTNYTIHKFTTTSFSREEAVAQAQFIRMYDIADYITNTLNKSEYSGNSWKLVMDTADYYTNAIRDCYAHFSADKVEELYAEALVALADISPISEFSIEEDFEDDSYEGNLKVIAGESAIVGSENNRYLDMTSTWNVLTSTQAAMNYKANVDFKVADTDAVFFNFNMWNTEGSRANGYMIRLYPNGNSLNAQLYRGNGTESDYTWIWTYAGTDVYYRGSNWHNLKILSYEGQMAIYLDNVLITPTSTSTDFTVKNGVVTDDTYKWGYFGFQSQSAIAIDNLTVTAIESLTDEMDILNAYNKVLGSWYFNETDALGKYWVTEDATLNVYDDRMNSLTLDSGLIALTGNATVYTPHLALTFKATDYTSASVLKYYYATSGENGYCVKITDSKVTLVRLDAGVETELGTAEYQAFDTLTTIRVFQSAGNTYVYADATQLICVADTTYYQGAVSVKAENLTLEVYKLALGSAVESAEIDTVAVKEDLVITLNPKVKDGQIYLGYVLSGGDYTGSLYNITAGDEIAYFDGLTYKAVVIDLKMNYGASARAKIGSGLRWTTTIPTEQYEELIAMGFSVGTRITSVGSSAHIDIPVVNGLIQDEEKGMTSWVASLINIREKNYERIYNGTAYVKGTYADGTEFQISGVNNNNKRTYKGVTMAALSDVKTSSAGEYTTAVEMVDGTSAYTYLTAEQYAFLKDIYATIEALEGDDDDAMYVNNNKTDGDTEIHFVNVSSADELSEDGITRNALSIFVEYNNQVILFDGGAGEEVFNARVIQCMKDEGIEKIDYLVLSHEHQDHAGGLPTIIEAFDVGTFYVRPQDTYNEWMESALEAVESKVNSDGSTVEIVIPRQEGYQVDMGEDTYFRLYNCTRIFESTHTDGNYYSLQMHFVSGEGKAFFGGDACGLAYNEEMLGKIGAVDIYQLQHHGINNMNVYNPAELIDELQPKYSVAATHQGSTLKEVLQTYLEKYGHIYRTGASGVSITFKQGEDGHFCLKSEAEKGAYDTATTVTIEDETELAFNGSSSRTDGTVTIGGDRGFYLTSSYGKAAAHKINVPENMDGEVLARFIGTDIYRESTGEGIVYFRIIQNGTVVYETAFTGSQGGKDYNVDLLKTITLKAGDELYFATYCSEGATNTTLYCTMAMYMDSMYYDAGHSNHINSANDNSLISKNHFNGTLYNNGSYYTCGEITSYVTFTVPEDWLFDVPEEATETITETEE